MFYKIYDATVEYLESVMDGEYIQYRSGNTITASDEKPLALIQFSDDEIFAIPSEELRKNLVDFAESFKIPKKVQENAKRALRWRAEGHKGGTSVGWNTARILARGGTIGERKIRHISKYFPRHEVDKKAEGFYQGEKGFPSPGRVAFDLWGGDEAWDWTKKIVEKLDKVDMNDTVNFRYIPKAERDALPDSDFGFVDGDRRLFPIVIEDDVMAAARLIGRAKGLSDNDKEAVKAKIIKIAKDKGFAIPKTWKVEMSDDLESELSENVLFSAAKDDIFDITVENKVFTLQVIEVKELQ